MPEMKSIRWSGLTPAEQQNLLQRPVFSQAGLADAVRQILRRVRLGGDDAVVEMTREFDGVDTHSYQINPDRMDAAVKAAEPNLVEAILDASERIRAFHTADMPEPKTLETSPGLTCSVRYEPLSPVGLYIPGGSAPLISTVMMLAIPAVLAGCEEIVMCSPPGRDGEVPDNILATARLCGVTRLFCAGGAQAIAAMAYGTASIPSCNKIFGPGNAWVTEAKQQVSQDPNGAAIDLPAGPSEVLVIADSAADPEFVAWDLLSQAEHGPDSQVILLTDSEQLATAVIRHLDELAPGSSRAEILQQSLAASRIIVVDNLDTALQISNRYAPEHLILNTSDAESLAGRAKNAGSVFIGAWTPESLGDYCSGTNHVLPTYGWARSHGALGPADFMRRMTLQQASRQALARVGPTAERLAAAEGLDAHRMAVRARLQSRNED